MGLQDGFSFCLVLFVFLSGDSRKSKRSIVLSGSYLKFMLVREIKFLVAKSGSAIAANWRGSPFVYPADIPRHLTEIRNQTNCDLVSESVPP